jgi:integrase/recombinase XerD
MTITATTTERNSKSNSNHISKYMDAMQIEINPSQTYKDLTFGIITNLSRYHKDKPFEKMKRDNIISYLNSIRKTDDQDPMHRWIATYNLYLTCITKFFKWFYHTDLSPKDRPKPKVVENVPQLKRKEVSRYKPSDLWTLDDDLLFLKWCPNKRDRCYHAISRDLSARPHEILNLKINDIIFKRVGDKQYAEVLVNGKTGTRHLPLINSLPYVKDWLDTHPQRNNPNSYLLCTNDRRFAHRTHVTERGLHRIYRRYKELFFPKLLVDPKVPTSEKEEIRDLLAKPWNPYVRRHSALTDKSKYLKESTLRQHAGWSGRSQMQLKYLHYFGNESNNSILQEYGILPKDNEEVDVLKPKLCPNCDEPNKPDSKFCAKCRMVLTYAAYNETLEKEQEKESEMQKLKEKQEQDMKLMREEMQNKFQQILAKIDVATLK